MIIDVAWDVKPQHNNHTIADIQAQNIGTEPYHTGKDRHRSKIKVMNFP